MSSNTEGRIVPKGSDKYRKSKAYLAWCGMRARCNNKNRPNYHRYGGRGISVCAEWSDFNVFRDWCVANGIQKDLSLDRVDNDGNYEPGNCRWATRIEQSNNTKYSARYRARHASLDVVEKARRENPAHQSIQKKLEIQKKLG